VCRWRFEGQAAAARPDMLHDRDALGWVHSAGRASESADTPGRGGAGELAVA
jgi:hypothetical protein